MLLSNFDYTSKHNLKLEFACIFYHSKKTPAFILFYSLKLINLAIIYFSKLNYRVFSMTFGRIYYWFSFCHIYLLKYMICSILLNLGNFFFYILYSIYQLLHLEKGLLLLKLFILNLQHYLKLQRYLTLKLRLKWIEQ